MCQKMALTNIKSNIKRMHARAAVPICHGCQHALSSLEGYEGQIEGKKIHTSIMDIDLVA